MTFANRFATDSLISAGTLIRSKSWRCDVGTVALMPILAVSGNLTGLERRIDAAAAHARHDHQILVALNPRGDGPFDIARIMHVDIIVHHYGMFDIGHPGEQIV